LHAGGLTAVCEIEPMEHAVEHVSGVNDDARGRGAVAPGEIERNRIRQAAVGEDAPQSARRLVDDVLGVSFPARRLRLIGSRL